MLHQKSLKPNNIENAIIFINAGQGPKTKQKRYYSTFFLRGVNYSFNKFPNYFLIYGNCRHYPTGNMQIGFFCFFCHPHVLPLLINIIRMLKTSKMKTQNHNNFILKQ